MKLPKWLPLQMAQMRTTCSKREGEITFFFYCNTLQKWRKKYQNWSNVAKFDVQDKRKNANNLFLSH